MTPSLATRYLGIDLPSPIIAGAGPLWREVDAIRRVVGAGAGAVVLPSLFEEQVMAERLHAGKFNRAFAESYASRLDLFPVSVTRGSTAAYLRLAQRAVAAVDVPVFASLNGTTPSGWVLLARSLEDVGVRGLELNFYYQPESPEESGAEVERRLIDIVGFTTQLVTIPVAVKLLPQFSSPTHLAGQLRRAGARGVVLFNRAYDPSPRLPGEAQRVEELYSSPSELACRLRWTTALAARGHVEVAVTGGVHTGLDVVRSLLAGATVAQVCTQLLRHGPEHLAVLRAELEAWMIEHGVRTVEDMRGQWVAARDTFPSAVERAAYARLLHGWRAPRRGGSRARGATQPSA